MTTAIEKLQKHTTAILVACKDKQEWLSERRIGGSSAPNLFDCGWGSRYAMWAELTSPPEHRESTERQQIGLGLEPFVCGLYRQKFGGEVEQWPSWTLARHPDRDYMHCTPDGVITDGELGEGPGAFSIKTWSENDQRSWIEEPPLAVQVQVQHELAVLDWQWGVVAVLFGAQKLERYVVERNDYFIAQLYDACQEFWGFVTNRIEPPIDESRATSLALARLHPDDSGAAVALAEDLDRSIIDLEDAKETIKSAERIKTRAENELKAAIGDATYGVTPEGRVYSWKTQERKEKCCEGCGAVVMAGSKFRVLRSSKSLPKGITVIEPNPLISESEAMNV